MATGPILIIDDEPSNLAILKQILDADYPLVFARNGQDGLAAARKHHPILVLLDIQMPDMDGYAVCRQLKSDPLTEGTPVIFVSSMSEVGDEAAGFACGAVDYIIKPVSPALVHARVRTHLSLVRAATLEHYVHQLELERVKTARLSRIQSVLSGTNSAIVRIREPQALLQEACRVAVTHGGFGIAWIGLLGADGQGITLSATEGAPAALPERTALALLTPDAPAWGIVQQVLDSGAAAVCEDLGQRGDFGHSCGDARARGFQSLVGIPLRTSERTLGVLVLYAQEAAVFDEEELKLLSELAGDISFALHAIDNEKRAHFLSYYSALTELPNATLFLDRLDQIVSGARRTGDAAFVIALNLERFKQINDVLGRHVGDQVLRMVARRLSENLARPCTLAHLGADNFALAGEKGVDEDISALCLQIVNMVGELMQIDGQAVQVSARLGVAVYPNDASDAESLFRNAEAALKQTKNVLARFLYYSQELNARIAEKVELEKLLKQAIDGEQFVMYYQPKVDARTGQITGAEALIRWQHPVLGMVPPDKFIPLAEETGLIVPIGAWVIRAVCAQQAAWLAAGVEIVPVALNLSALQFREGNVLETVQQALEANLLDAGWVELELTETLVMQDAEGAQQTMRAFLNLGLKLSLDDFGTGYSSLAYLKRFPFQYVKIDRAFVTDITHNPDDAAIATAVIAMAHSLHMEVIAEGVETEAQLHFLRRRQCDYIQGYYFSRPVPAADFCAMLGEGKHIEFAPTAAELERTLLVVDDDPAFLAAIRRSLRGEGYRVLTAANGLEALEQLATCAVQVVLCDQLLQKKGGKTFLGVVAQLYPDTMRIVLSGYTELQSVLDAVNRGEIYRFLTKPWEDKVLRQSINDAFSRFRATAEPVTTAVHERPLVGVS
ncbi:EAL domain-containing protein [Oxalobacteraceae bacterium]|nr:EAL domain-containing protein [Oxalobacteraceae bacterium]